MDTKDEATNAPAPKATAQPAPAESVSKKVKPGFRADGTAYPGVDPVTGERRTVTYNGLREEFGEVKGTRLYNLIASAGYGGVMRHKPALSLRSLRDENAAPDLTDARLKQRADRRHKVMDYIKQAEEGLT
jgi:hypothetical protein